MTTLRRYLQTARDMAVLDALRECHHNRRLTAKRLGISLRTLFYQLDDMRARGIQVPRRRPCEGQEPTR